MIPSFIKGLLPGQKPIELTPAECPACALRISAMQSLHDKYMVARAAQSTADRRIKALKKTNPQIWWQFFTKDGEAKRMEATNNE